MDINKTFIRTFVKEIFSDPVKVVYWDGEEENFGEGKEKFSVIFNKCICKKDIIKDPFLAFGEAYMNNDIDFQGASIQTVIESIYRCKDSFLSKSETLLKFKKVLPNGLKKSKKDIHYHYDLGNDFYKLWLDETMSYSCGYFKTKDTTLYEAQIDKIEYLLKKLNLREGERLLDIGCGWGHLIITAAKKYGVKALGITLSEEQFKRVQERIKEENLEDKVEVKLMDYRELEASGEKFDRIISVGMIEHVGRKNIPVYMEAVHNMLNEGGLSVLHCITGQTESEGNEWIKKYIFPGGYIPSVRELIGYMPDYDFHLVDVESLRLHYCRTLELWAENFENALDKIREMKDEKFIRMWDLYLQSCAASFHYGVIDLHQFIFTKGLVNDLPMTRDYLYK